MSFLSMCKELKLIFVDFRNNKKIQSANKYRKKKSRDKKTHKFL